MKKTYKTSLRIFLFFSFLFIANCEAQPSITWNKIYDGPHHIDYAYAICKSQTTNSYYVGGISGNHSYVLKINDYGDTAWSKYLDFGGAIFNIASTTDGGCVFAGIESAMLTVKLDSIGNIVWQKSYNILFNRINCLQNTPDGGFIGCGDYNASDAIIFKIDSSGNLLWYKTYSGYSSLTFTSIIKLNNGGYLASGNDYGFGNPTLAVLIRIDDKGNQIWLYHYRIFNHEATAGNVDIHNNNFIMSGATVGGNYFSKVDTSGNIIFSIVIPYPINETYDCMKIVTPNKFVFSSVTTSQAQDTFYAKLTLVDSSGNILQTKLLPSRNAFVEMYAIQVTDNYDIIFAGPIDDYYTNYEDILLVRTDNNLNFPPIGIINTSNNIPKKFELHQNYPNPFNPQTTIKFDVPYSTQVTLKVFDLLGREVWSYSDVKPTGNYSVHFDGSNLASGVYFYRLEAGKFVESKKMVLIK